MGRNLKLVASLTLVGMVVVFVAQNTEVLDIQFLAWSFEIRRAFLIFLVLGIGIIVGWVLRGRPRPRNPGRKCGPSEPVGRQ